jgi:hypothetical protein
MDLQRQPGVQPGPHEVSQKDRIGQPRHTRSGSSEMRAGRCGDLPYRGTGWCEIEAVAVGRYRLHGNRGPRRRVQRLGERGGEALSGLSVPKDPLGERLEPDDLVGAAPGRDSDVRWLEQRSVQAGVDEVVADSGRAQQAPGYLVRPQVGASGEIVLRRGVWREAEQRWAQRAYREAELGVEP